MTTVQVSPVTPAEVQAVADLAARTFPLACPPSATADNIAAFITTTLSAQRFADYLDDPDRTVLAARDSGVIVGYAMLICGLPDDPDVRRAVTVLPTMELSKIYVLPSSHGGAASAALMRAALDHATHTGARSMWLGVNQENQRAQRFYAKHGFAISGTKSFQLGAVVEHDFVLTRAL